VPPSGSTAIEDRLEAHRVELTGYCYRMLGSSTDAEDAVQETLTRAWRAYDRFEERSSLRTWLFRIATNVCFDALDAGKRRARPMDLSGPWAPDGHVPDPLLDFAWLEPVPDTSVLPDRRDPGDVIVARESIRLAFVAALQHLPSRQRAVLILREVLAWSAQDVADLLDTSVPAVNSALQRARTTLDRVDFADTDPWLPDDAEQRLLLGRYLDAFERYDIDALTALIHEDATQSMPPYELWLSGRDDILKWWVGPGAECAGSRLVPTVANGSPAFGQYRTTGPWALQVLEIEDGRIVELSFFLDTATLFPRFQLPMAPDGPRMTPDREDTT
jgi:RNA polymerase sigma-70 factor (ECF subfamily)